MTNSKSPFDPTFSIARNAHVDTTHSGRSVYANGYFIAADILTRHAQDDRLDRNFLALPICYLYRHNLELQLKELIAVGQRVVRPINEKLNHHRIKRLWAIARELLRDAAPEKPEPKEFRKVDELIDHINTVDDDGQAFRFPTKMNGDRSLSTVTEIDLDALRETANSVTLLLWGCIDWLDDLGQSH
jgi:hypothetical protein